MERPAPWYCTEIDAHNARAPEVAAKRLAAAAATAQLAEAERAT